MPKVADLTNDERRQLAVLERFRAHPGRSSAPVSTPVVVETPDETLAREKRAMVVRRGLDPDQHVVDERSGEIRTRNGG